VNRIKKWGDIKLGRSFKKGYGDNEKEWMRRIKKGVKNVEGRRDIKVWKN
jgi:hypothetical protein